jgi:hypothetical protein
LGLSTPKRHTCSKWPPQPKSDVKKVTLAASRQDKRLFPVTWIARVHCSTRVKHLLDFSEQRTHLLLVAEVFLIFLLLLFMTKNLKAKLFRGPIFKHKIFIQIEFEVVSLT